MIYPDRYSRNFSYFNNLKKTTHVSFDASQKKTKIEASFIRFNKGGSIILQIRIFNWFLFVETSWGKPHFSSHVLNVAKPIGYRHVH